MNEPKLFEVKEIRSYYATYRILATKSKPDNSKRRDSRRNTQRLLGCRAGVGKGNQTMKYVMFSVEVGGVTKMVPVIFPDFMVHEDIAKAVTAILTDMHKFAPKIESAGDINLGLCECSGRSETLKLSSSKADSHIVTNYDYLHGLVY